MHIGHNTNLSIVLCLTLLAFSTAGCASALDFAIACASDAVEDAILSDDESSDKALAVAATTLVAAVAASAVLEEQSSHPPRPDRSSKYEYPKRPYRTYSESTVAYYDDGPRPRTELEPPIMVNPPKTACPMAEADYRVLHDRIIRGDQIEYLWDSIASQQVADLLPLLEDDSERARLAILMYDVVCDRENWSIVYQHISDVQILAEMEAALNGG